jgi:transposase
VKANRTKRFDVHLETETDIDKVRAIALYLVEQVDALRRQIRKLEAEISRLKKAGASSDELEQQLKQTKEQLALLQDDVFGPSSEKTKPGEDGGKNKTADRSGKTPKSKPAAGHGPHPQPDLQREERTHTLDEADRKCPKCGGRLEPIEGQFESSEQIDVHKRTYVVVEEKRQKYGCRCGACVETAPGPLKPIKGGRYSLRFGIDVAVNKYEYHAPLERQARQMRREGLEIQNQTLWDQINAIARINEPLLDRFLRHLVDDEPVLGADETRWPILAKRGCNKGGGKNWYVWVIGSPRAVLYRIASSRGKAVAEELLDGFEGFLVTDGYGVYISLAKDRPGIVSVFCWAHVRRLFVKAAKFYPEAKAYIELINQMFDLNDQAGHGEDPETLEKRKTIRRTKIRPLVGKLFKMALACKALDTSALGKAVNYMLNLRKGLVRFLNDPRIPLHNNASEQALRDPVLGRKNHYGSKSQRGTEVAALMYTVMENASRNDLKPHDYLLYSTATHLLGGTPLLPHELTPERLEKELEALQDYL